MRYRLSEIANCCKGQLIGSDRVVETILFDSRGVLSRSGALFVCLKGNRDGHRYIGDVAERGITSFLISDLSYYSSEIGSAVVVDDVLDALQTLAAEHRKKLGARVTAIIGSNGKSIVKEWIWQMAEGKKLYRSPRSYNSQLGVALSILAAPLDASEVIIEAGISQVGEMELLERMVAPDRVIITNIGQAHDSGFSSREQKIKQKMVMMRSASSIIYPAADRQIGQFVDRLSTEDCQKISFGVDCGDVNISRINGGVRLSIRGREAEVSCRYMSDIEMVNCAAAIAFFINSSVNNFVDNSINISNIAAKIANLQSVAMRLELRSGRDSGVVINDSYSNDLDSLSAALDYLELVADGRDKVVVLSDITSSSIEDEELYKRVSEMISAASITRFIGVGERLYTHRDSFDSSARFYCSTEDLMNNLPRESFNGSALLIKGGRAFGLERLSLATEQQIHSTVLEVNLEQIASNLNHYRSHLKPKVKMMAMVKAFGYGMGGGGEIAMRLQREGVDYLAVAYADEGVELRKAGITMPIVVLNSDPSGYPTMIEHSLEPEIYSFHSLSCFSSEVRRSGLSLYPIHIKIDSGMHRLGFERAHLDRLIPQLAQDGAIKVVSIFSHLAVSENESEDQFTREQIEQFSSIATDIKDRLDQNDILIHICNSAGIIRHPYAHMDMVRVGIGLYEQREGVEVARLRSVVVDVKSIRSGESVSYGRRYRADGDRKIAVVAIGYADGLDRRLSCGAWSFMINERLCPIVGSICMDVCMVDVTDAGDVLAGDMVEVFGEGNSADMMAQLLDTINYEIFTSISRRVKRVFVKE